MYRDGPATAARTLTVTARGQAGHSAPRLPLPTPPDALPHCRGPSVGLPPGRDGPAPHQGVREAAAGSEVALHQQPLLASQRLPGAVH